MATVPGDPNDTGNGRDPYGGIPKELRPGYPELLMAAAIHKQQQDQKLAGDVIPTEFPKRSPWALSDEERAKAATRETLSRALGGTSNVLPMTPGKQSMQFDPLDPKDDDDDAKPPPKPKPRPKKEKT